MLFVKHKSVKGNSKSIESDKKFVKSFICIDLPVLNVVFFVDLSTIVGSVWVVRLLRVILSVGKVEFGVHMGGMVVVGGVLADGLGLGDTVVGLVSVLIGLLHLCRCLGVGIVVGLSEGGIVVVGGNIVVTVGGIFSFGAMAVGGGNVIVGMGLDSTVVVNVVDVVCPFCFCCVLGGNVVDLDLLLDHLRSLTKSSAGFSSFSLFSISLALFNLFSLSSDPERTTFPCETFTIAS